MACPDFFIYIGVSLMKGYLVQGAVTVVSVLVANWIAMRWMTK